MNKKNIVSFNSVVMDIFQCIFRTEVESELLSLGLEVKTEFKTPSVGSDDCHMSFSISDTSGSFNDGLEELWEEIIREFIEVVEEKELFSKLTLLLDDFDFNEPIQGNNEAGSAEFYLMLTHDNDPDAVYKLTITRWNDSEVTKSTVLSEIEILRLSPASVDRDDIGTTLQDIVTSEILDHYQNDKSERLLSQLHKKESLAGYIDRERFNDHFIDLAGSLEFRLLGQYLSATPKDVIEIYASKNYNLSELVLDIDAVNPLSASFQLRFDDEIVRVHVQDIFNLHPMTQQYSSNWSRLCSCTSPSLKKIYFDALAQLYYFGSVNLKLLTNKI